MGKIRGTHSSPGIYTLITNVKKQSKTRIGLVGNNTGGYTPNISPGGNKPIVNKYLTFTALEGNCAIGFYNNPDSSIVPTVEYSFDKNTWNVLTEDKVIIPQNTNMYCRGLNPDGVSGGYDENGYNYFIGEGKFNVSGDIMSLIDYNTMPETMVGTFYNLFGGEGTSSRDNFVDIVDASKLVLSAKVLTSDCYANMFDSCTSMVYGPQIKATTLAPFCCYKMFYNCFSLITAPDLPANKLEKECYAYMFSNCGSLSQAPELPAMTLADSCYSYMFESCTSLTAAPALPATELANSCYNRMFYYCTSLTTAPELPATELANSCYGEMFYYCTSLTTAPELPATTLADYCYWSMFQGCRSLNKAPELPATTLARECYYAMFYDCTSLTTAPELPATTLAEGCYYEMFNNCSSLNTITCLATDISATNCTSYWVNGVSSTGTFVKHPDMTSWTRGINGIPRGWNLEDTEIPYVTFTAQEDNSSIGLGWLSTNQTLKYSRDGSNWSNMNISTNISLNNGDKVYVRGVLSADNTSSNYTRFKMSGKISASGNCNAIWNYNDLNAPLKARCGAMMFADCTSLITAPELPATELAQYCYYEMFGNCSSLTIAPELPATKLAERCYTMMFSSCTSLTTAPEILPATELSQYCYSAMFQSCDSLITAPELPATTLDEGCYQFMFNMCTSLNYITCLATDISAGKCTQYWVNEISGTGTFVKNPDMNNWTNGVKGIPSGWVVENYTE